MKKPPLLPFETLRRVLRLARFNGTVMLVIAGTFALGSASTHDIFSTVVGLLIAAAGAMEMHGAAVLKHGAARGMNWLVASQLYLIVVVLGYVTYGLQHIDVSVMKPLLSAEQTNAIVQTGYTVDAALRLTATACYVIFAVATVIYQGAMTLYYVRRRAAVQAALLDLAMPE